MQLPGHGDMGACTLAAPAEIGGVACAAGTEFKLVDGMLYSCTVAKQTRFGPIELPPGSFVAYPAAKPGWFRLPAAGPAVDGFGLSLPAGTEAGFCYQSEALQRLAVDQTAYVTVEGVKLTGAIDFDCGHFERGVLSRMRWSAASCGNAAKSCRKPICRRNNSVNHSVAPAR